MSYHQLRNLSWDYFEKTPLSNRRQGSREAEQVCDIKSEVSDLLNLFKIRDYFPGKLSLQNVLSIDNKSQSDIKQVTDIPWAILHRIISVDFHFRENILDEFIRRVQKSSSIDDEDDLFDTSNQTYQSEEKGIALETLHPSDVFLTIFQCCDPFLKQTIVQKVSLCQLAVPYIYPDYTEKDFVLSIWPLRGIFLDSTSECVAAESLKTIAFVRVGKGLDTSKSKIINEILRSQNEEHGTFFHRDCPLGMTTRKIANQVIEASWYVPSQSRKQSEKQQEEDETEIKEKLTVLNLRGDAHGSQNQLNNLLAISNIVTVFINYQDLKCMTYINTLQILHSSNCHVLLLTDQSTLDRSDKEFIEQYKIKIDLSKTKMISTFSRKKGRFMNANELKMTLKKNICILVTATSAGINLEKISTTMIRSDENKTCTEMKTIVESIYSDITQYDNLTHRKQYFTPLQCDNLWQKWSRKQKQQHRQKSQQSYDPRETLLQEMDFLRKEQVRVCNSAPDTFGRFVWVLLDLIDDASAIQYFIGWMRYKLDKDSRIIIPNLMQDFYNAFQKYESAKTKSENLKQKLDIVESELTKASFGLEHFFREFGQVYEAFMYCKQNLNYTISEQTHRVINQLPVVVAKLLLLGQPLELMDGDAANVPLVWVKAVFLELKAILHNKTICSISVLGIQSSGKSTLLNTMFGLNFAVSAGRCTRGIFAQIVPVDRQKTNLKFDYVLLLDTEGLRAPEHAHEKLNHDNELATFVIGLADIVVVNIKGETISEMEDILQIVVHGLLRLKQANEKIHLQQRSILVHQNVPAEDAQKQMVQGNKKTVESLDKMTKEVALQEGCSSVACFRDVIKFDPTKDVRFLPDLFYGTRPMAPISHHYSEKALDVKASILEYTMSDHSFLTVENKMLHMDSLWKGILAEDFVFSFRNCLEIKAYSQLELHFQGLISELDLSKLDWITDNIKPELHRCDPTQILEKAGKLKKAFRVKIREEQLAAETNLKQFVENSDLNEIMIQWKERKLIALSEMATNAIQDVDTKVEYELNQCETLRKSNDILAIKEEQLNNKAKEIASSFRGMQLTDDAIKRHFDSIWQTWVDELVPETEVESMEKKNREMMEDLENILYDKFSEQVPIMRKELSDGELSIPFSFTRLENSIRVLKKSNLQSKSRFSFVGAFKRGLISPDSKPVLNAINTMLSDIDSKFDILSTTDAEYDKSHFRQVIDTIRKGFRNYNGNDNNDYSLTPKFEIFLAVHTTKYCCMKYKEIIWEYEREHGLRKRIENLKLQKQQFFIDLCQAKSQEIIVTNLICSTLQYLIKERFLRILPPKIQRQMVDKYKNQKSTIIKSILKELATEDNFNSYMSYVHQPAEYALRWITKTTYQLIFEKQNSKPSFYHVWLDNELGVFIDDIRNAMVLATRKVQAARHSENNFQLWIDIFADQLGERRFVIETYTFLQIKRFSINSLSEVSDNILKDISGNIRRKVERDLKNLNQTSIKWPLKTPYECIYEQLWGCKEHCPFCGEPCQRSDVDHGSPKDCHTCIQHRPGGIHGVWWKETRKLCIESCNFEIQSTNETYCGSWCSCPTPDSCESTHPYKEYKRFYPLWDIEPCQNISSSDYWNWFMRLHAHDLAKYHGKELPDIPESWDKLNKNKAVDSIDNLY